MRTLFTCLLWAAFVALASATAAYAGLHVETGGQVAPLLAAKIFCDQHPAFCGREPQAQQIHLTDKVLRDLSVVNRSVNASIAVAPDLDVSGNLTDVWTLNPADHRGDCEDFALTKRAQLLKRGYPPGALRIAVGIGVIPTKGVADKNGHIRKVLDDSHAVLVVVTDKEDFALDNRFNEVVPWFKDYFLWEAIMSPTDQSKWLAVKPST